MLHRFSPKALRTAVGVVLLCGLGLAAKPGLPFIEDDYQQALAQARAKKLPLFVEAWAPW